MVELCPNAFITELNLDMYILDSGASEKMGHQIRVDQVNSHVGHSANPNLQHYITKL